MLTPRWFLGRHGWLGLGLVACLQACGSNKSNEASGQTGSGGSSGTAATTKNGGAGSGGKASASTSSARTGAAQGGNASVADEDAGVSREDGSAAGSGGAAAKAAGSGGKGGAGSKAAGGAAAAGSGGTSAAGSGGAEAAGGEAAGSGGAEAAGSGGSQAAPECRTDKAPEIPALKLETVVASGSLDTLTFATQPPDSDDWYLVEQRGRVLIVRDGKLLDTPFLDLTREIALGAGFDQTTITYDERGLISLAFAPDYAESGLFYIAITPSAPDDFFSPGLQVNHDQVLEYRRNGDNPDRADTSPLRKLIDVPSSPAALGNIHNANTVRFGPDGKLYVGMGDGGGVNCNDAEPGAPQDIDRPFGKLMRLDLGANAPYGASDNPFADRPSAATVLHYGLRNPFRFSFDRETGDLYIGDVGQSTYEEINFAKAGSQALNFGWPTFEAESPCPGPQRSLRAGSTPTSPIFFADRAGTGRFRDYRAIVGGVVYRGSALPQLRGTYVFGDYYGTRLGALKRCEDATSPANVIRKNCDPNFAEPCLDADRGSPEFRQLTAIVEDHGGEIHLVANGNSLLKVVPGN